MLSPTAPSSPPFLGGSTSFSSVTDPTLHRRGWRNTSARDDPAMSSQQIPPRYRGLLRYDLLSEANAVFRAADNSKYAAGAGHMSRQFALKSQTASRSASANEPEDDGNSSHRRTNLDELKWFEHRWLDKHGKNSQLKEFREKMTLMRRWFESLDADGSGEVGLDELEDPLVSVGLARSRDDVQKLIDEVDKDGKGEVTFNQFLNLMYPKKAKRSSRQQQRAPLHQPKARIQVQDSPSSASHQITSSATTAVKTAATTSTKVDAQRPTSPLANPRASRPPSSPAAGGSSPTVVRSPRRSSSRHVTTTASKNDASSQGKVNPVVKLFEDLQSGKLGDLAIPFPVLITAYRRRMLLNAHMADDPTARSLGTSVLQALESTRREVVPQSSDYHQAQRSDSIAFSANHAFVGRRSSSSSTSSSAATAGAPSKSEQQLQQSSNSHRKRSTLKQQPILHLPAAQLPALG